MTYRKNLFLPACCLILALTLLALIHLLPVDAQAVSVEVETGAIAYVRTGTADEIRLIEADGRNDRLLWTRSQADPGGDYAILSLDWRPDASEIAFASTHEQWCSINQSDVFVIGVDGSGYRRITQAPACAALAGFPQGTVQVAVTNDSFWGDAFDGALYMQGAASAIPVSVPAGGSSVVVFDSVADFGQEVFQYGVIIAGFNRAISVGMAVDVQADRTVTTGPVSVYHPDTFWEVRSPTWHSAGSRVGYVLNFNSLSGMAPNPAPLTFGEELLSADAHLPSFVNLMAYAPTQARANQILYQGSEAFESEAIYLVTEGSATAGQQLVSYGALDKILGLAWLPDGSGFVYAVKEWVPSWEVGQANIFIYSFDTQQTTQLTNFSSEFAGRLSVSPDGQQIVFEHASAMAEHGRDLVDPNLWIVNRDGSGLRLLVENGRAPAWSPRVPQIPTPTATPTPDGSPGAEPRIFLPLTQR